MYFPFSWPRILTPYYSEDVLFSMNLLEKPNEDGVSILFYLQKIYPGFFFLTFSWIYYVLLKFHPIRLIIPIEQWTNFLERVQCANEEELRNKLELEDIHNKTDELKEELRLWASYRGQTLTKTGKVKAPCPHPSVRSVINHCCILTLFSNK